MRNTGPSTWLPVWLKEIEEFPEEYGAETFLDAIADAQAQPASHNDEPDGVNLLLFFCLISVNALIPTH